MVRIQSGSAITVLNAIKSDFGCAIGVEMDNWVEITKSDIFDVKTFPEQDPILIDWCWNLMKEKYDINKQIKVETHSQVSGMKGTKTSSAISSACIKAMSDFFTLQLKPSEIISISAKASINAGVSITGASDDAYACLYGGLAITKTESQEIVYHSDFQSDYEIVLLIPNERNPKTQVKYDLEDYPTFNSKPMIKKIQQGDILSVIKENTKYYAPKLLKDDSIVNDLQDYRAEVIGLNGAGPSLFALCLKQNLRYFMDAVENSFNNYFVIHTQSRKYNGDRFGQNRKM